MVSPVSLMPATDSSWMTDAACIGNVDLFFPPERGEQTHHRVDRELAAKAICKGCPVLSQCLDYALEERMNHGIWGGLDPKERKKLIRGRAQQRAKDRR